MDTIRIPIAWIRHIAETYNDANVTEWRFTSNGGNILVAKRALNAESVDFEYNPGD